MTAYTQPLPTTEPTTCELLNRICRRLLLQGPGEFNRRWELTRHRCYVEAEALLARERLFAQIEAQRAALALLQR